MNEEPKSIWKKRLGGKWLGSLLLALASGAIFIIIGAMAGVLPVGALLAGACVVVVLVLWPLIAFIRWLFSRGWRQVLFRFACFATLIALFYAEENWRGKRAWENYKHEWGAKGEKFDFKDFVPPPVPDNQNFALTPIMFTSYRALLNRDGTVVPMEQRLINLKDTNFVAECSRLNFDLGEGAWKTNATGYWVKGTVSNLKLWQDWYRALAATTNLFAVPTQPQSPAADVLLALSKFDSTVAEMQQASHLPECRFPLNYDSENPWNIFLPHLSVMKSSARLLQVRAIAELENGESEKALADVKLSLRLVSGIRQEPFLITQLVRYAMAEIILQTIYEGLAAHRWTDAQLGSLDAELAQLDFLADYQASLRGERGVVCWTIDWIGKKKSHQRYRELLGEMQGNLGVTTDAQLIATAKLIGISLMPTGWFDQNKLFAARGEQGWITGIVSPAAHLAEPQKYREVDESQSELFNGAGRPWNFLAKEFFPALGAMAKKSAREQISVDLARTAIALERYRLARGEFPESLDALAPQFIAQVPHDVIGGQPLKYRHTRDGQFVLYSIGWNEKDDGGVMVAPKGGFVPRFEEGDWVWRYPQK